VRWLRIICALLACACPAFPASLPAYQLGDIAKEDVVTPVTLIVLDRAATDALREGQAAAPRYLVRFQPARAARAEAAFRDAVAGLRSNFLHAMRAAYPLTKVTSRNLPSKRFQQLTNSFQQAHPAFPLHAEVVRLWALGLDDTALFEPLAEQIRGLMERPLLPDELVAQARAGDAVQLVYESAAAPPGAAPTAWLASPTNLVTLHQARDELVRAAPEACQGLAAFAATFLEPNCTLETAPPSPAVAWRAEPFVVAYRYEAGEAILRRGQRVDARAVAALAQLRDRLAVAELQQQVAASQTLAQVLQRQTAWLLAGVLTLGGVVLLVLLRLSRRHGGLALAPAPQPDRAQELAVSPGQSPVSGPGAGCPDTLRRGLLAQLSALLGSRLVRTLLFQCQHLLTAEREAAEELEALTRRLEEARAPLRERLAAYERRIVELERELAQKGAENRALLEAKIELTRLRLNEEKSGRSAELN